MGITKTQLKNRIEREFGHPIINVELHDDQLNDIITRTKKIHQKWAVGNATQEVFMVKVIDAGTREYELPTGIVSVIDMTDTTDNFGSANQLFTIQNYMVNSGILNFYHQNTFSLVDYHIGLNFMDELKRYTVSSFQWRYKSYNNTLMLTPVPSASNSWDSSSTNYMMIRGFLAEGYDIDTTTDNPSAYYEYIYEDPWFFDYCVALSKIALGHIRRKFANFQSIGNTGIQLDGDQLLSEGKEEKEKLEEQLRDHEAFEGYGIEIG